jgi:dipeptide/tripeptide permease
MLANWKTTTAGVGAILIAAGHFLFNASNGDFSTAYADAMAISVGWGLIVAKDHNVTGGNVPQS